MRIGIPKEIKNHEYRVGASPGMVLALIQAGHQVIVQKGAGAKIGFQDEDYGALGANLVKNPAEVYKADMVIKVKEPQEEEYPLLREGLILFCYLHLAPDPKLTAALLEKKVVGIAYETVTDPQGRLPLLVPASEVAGRLSIQIGATYLQMNNGGRGILLGGVPGTLPAYVTIIGGGVSGTEAVRMALGMGAEVTVIDKNIYRLRELSSIFGPALRTLYSTSKVIEEAVVLSDLVIGAVLIPGKTAPKLVTRSMIKQMQPGSVVVDIAIDQGGCFETSRPTSHDEPTYIVDGVIHYCVTNMPGSTPRTSTIALTNSTLEYALAIANQGWREALKNNPYLAEGLNVCLGKVTHRLVAEDLGYTMGQ
jgi:alanine dehydrogenase